MSLPLLSVEVNLEPDVILARQRARQIAGLLGFPSLDQTRIATATSEIARNAFERAGGGRVEFLVDQGARPLLLIRVEDRTPVLRSRRAPFAADATVVPAADLRSLGARRLMDRFEAEPRADGGERVSMAKHLPRRADVPAIDLARIAGELSRQSPKSLLEELQEQNQELLRTLHELREQQGEIAQLHARELEETNRGVVALYAELDENTKALKRISDLKSRFLSNMSHEFRSPLNTILSLSGFLLERSDGELTPEQEKQVTFIRKAAEGLATLVNDLLDLAKVEAGKAVVRLDSFEVGELFESLRGATQPLLEKRPVALRFEAAADLPRMRTDEGKVSQILRNFLSNAVKFTEQGEIRVSAETAPGDTILFSVADTGIGIAVADRKRIFEEFGQIEGPLQAKVKGTGLGLPLSRKLAELLGGAIAVRGEPGAGSTFVVLIPRSYRETGDADSPPEARWRLDPTRRPLLIVEDDAVDRLVYEKLLERTQFQAVPARSLDEARRMVRRAQPVAVILDHLPEEEETWLLLKELKSHEDTKAIPLIVLTRDSDRERARELGAAEVRSKPFDPAWLLKTLEALVPGSAPGKVLVIDDEEPHRYVLRELLSAQGGYVIIEAAEGRDGVRRARDERPDAIFLDLAMPDMTGFEVLERLKADPETRDIPVIIYTSKILEDEERTRLNVDAAAVIAKATGLGDEMFSMIRGAMVRAGLGPAPAQAET